MAMIEKTAAGSILYPDEVAAATKLYELSLLKLLTKFTVPVEGDEVIVRVPYTPDDVAVSFVKEGDEIPFTENEISEVEIRTAKLAALRAASWELIRANTLGEKAINLLLENISQSIIKKANHVLFNNQDPKASTGLLHIEGMHDLGQQSPKNFDAFSDGIAAIEAENGQATAIVIDPVSWGKLRKNKIAGGSNQLLLGSPIDPTPVTLFGVPVIVNGAMPSGTALVIDGRNVLSSYGEARIERSDDFLFGRDSVIYRLTWRFGFTPIYPKHLAKFTFDFEG